jgi:hypothetical protein
MKNVLKSFVTAAAMVGLSAMAQFSTLPSYQTVSSSMGTSLANVILPQKPTSQIRLVSLIAQSDLTTSAVNLYSGATARSIGVGNTNISSTLVLLDSTNGLVPSALLYLQGATSNVVGTVSSFTTTNISGVTYGYVLSSAAAGIPQVVGAEAEVLGTPITFSLGLKTNQVWASDGLFVGNYGRAVYATVNGTSNCQLNAVTVHYDSSSQ